MKKISFKHRLLFVGMVGLLFTACEEGNQEFDIIQETVERGAVLRTVNLISNELPIGAADAGFSVEMEVQDQENGALLDNIEVYVGFLDNTDDVGPGTNVDQTLFGSISSSEFTIGEFGLPRTTYSVSLTEMLAHVGRTEADITGGDQFEVRFELVLSDGRRYSNADNSGTITGSFFNSPFLYTPTVTCNIPAEAFVGMYLIEQTTPEIGGSVTLSSGSVVELTIGDTSVERVFQTENYPVFCGGDFAPFKFELICGRISVPTQNGLCVCDDGTDFFTQPEVQEVYDINDDTTFLVTFTDDAQSDCGAPAQTTYRFTKQ